MTNAEYQKLIADWQSASTRAARWTRKAQRLYRKLSKARMALTAEGEETRRNEDFELRLLNIFLNRKRTAE